MTSWPLSLKVLSFGLSLRYWAVFEFYIIIIDCSSGPPRPEMAIVSRLVEPSTSASALINSLSP